MRTTSPQRSPSSVGLSLSRHDQVPGIVAAAPLDETPAPGFSGTAPAFLESVGAVRYTGAVSDDVIELLLTEVAFDKLGARNISADETVQVLRNAHVVVRNPRAPDPGSRRLLIGRTTAAAA
jgi:hypothetical protein